MHVYEPNPQQPQFPFPIPRSQFPFPNFQPNVENFDANEDEKDWFLEAFLIGYKTEKDRRKRLGAEKEERKKKEVAREKYEKERRREERVNFENKLMEELKDMKNTLETMEVEDRKLRQEVEEMRRSMKEEKIVKIVVDSFSEEELRKRWDALTRKENLDNECESCKMPELLHKGAHSRKLEVGEAEFSEL